MSSMAPFSCTISFPAVVVVIQKFHGDAAVEDGFVADAGAIRVVVEGSVMVVVVEAIQFEIEVRDVDVEPAVAIHVGGVDAHAGFVTAVLAGRHAGNERNILKGSVVLVEKKKIRPGVVGDGDVRPAVAVEVREDDAHAFRFGLADAGCVAHVGESAVVIVVVELGFLSLVIVGIAVRAIAGAAFAAPEICFRRPFDVIGDNEIEPAVLVVIKPARAGGPSAFIGDAGFGGDVGESSVTVVVVENRAAVAGDVEIGVAVVVVIADGNALAVMSLRRRRRLFR